MGFPRLRLLQNYPSLNVHAGQISSSFISEWLLARISCSVDNTFFLILYSVKKQKNICKLEIKLKCFFFCLFYLSLFIAFIPLLSLSPLYSLSLAFIMPLLNALYQSEGAAL